MEVVVEEPVVFGSQQFIDRVNLLCHREIARRLAREPEQVLSVARDNLTRWIEIHKGSNAEQALQEWREILETYTIPKIIELITQDSDEGQRLRSSTPFAGILSDAERKEIYRTCAKGILA